MISDSDDDIQVVRQPGPSSSSDAQPGSSSSSDVQPGVSSSSNVQPGDSSSSEVLPAPSSSSEVEKHITEEDPVGTSQTESISYAVQQPDGKWEFYSLLYHSLDPIRNQKMSCQQIGFTYQQSSHIHSCHVALETEQRDFYFTAIDL